MKNFFIKITFLWFIFILSSCSFSNIDYYIFSNINECELMENNIDTGNIHKLNAREEDVATKKLKSNDFYAAEFIFDDWDFKIFAYEFTSSQEAQEYFKNNTGKAGENSTFSATKGMKQYRIIAINNKNAYKVVTAKENSKKVDDWLSQNFTLKYEKGSFR